MLPRKRHRPNPTSSSPEAPLSRTSPASEQAPNSSRTPHHTRTADVEGSKTPTLPHKKLIHKTQSWYGSWPRPPKASPSTSVARENISGGTIKSRSSPVLGRFQGPKDDDTGSCRGVKRDSSAPPKAAETSLHGPVRSSDKMGDEGNTEGEDKNDSEMPMKPPSDSSPHPAAESSPNLEPSTADDGTGADAATKQEAQQQSSSGGWLSWWYHSTPTIPPNPPPQDQTSEPEPATERESGDVGQGGAGQGEPGPGEAHENAEAKQQAESESALLQNPSSSQPPLEGSAQEPAPAAGWFSYVYLPSRSMLPSVPGFRYKRLQAEETDAKTLQSTAEGQGAIQEATTVKESLPGEESWKKDPVAIIEETTAKEDKTVPQDGRNDGKGKADKSSKDTAAEDATVSLAGTKSNSHARSNSTWVFWSSYASKDTPMAKGKAAETETGEIAVMGEGSETQPTPMAEGDVSPPSARDGKSDAEAKDAQASSTRSMWRRKKKHGVSQSLDLDSPLSSSTESMKPIPGDQSSAAAPQVAEQVATPTRSDTAKKSTAVSEILAKHKPNLLLPSFSSTYQMKENPSILQQITNLVVRSSQPPPNHVLRIKDVPRVRKAIAIGVHGFFPATYLRPMIGQPTGTSLRFASLAADAIRRWADAHGSPNCEIEKVALEGEGRINDRVDNLWKLMLNWVEHIREADLIIMACHSQGVPVGVMLLQKLIDLGIVTRARIGVCAMAGVSLGPFPDYKSSILMGSAAELWEFGNPLSNNSRRFELSLKRVLDYGARVAFIGSIDDQLVPMESAVYSPANHPYIYRAVFIDGRIHAPDFIAHLVGFALKLRNLGVSDHGLIRELSVALAGSLYSGEGHSRLYYDDQVYDLAIAHALETSDTPRPTPCHIPKREMASSNPYVLPWIMRGLLEERLVKTELSEETEELLRQFDDWKPVNKALKDVKYRLEAVRSKL